MARYELRRRLARCSLMLLGTLVLTVTFAGVFCRPASVEGQEPAPDKAPPGPLLPPPVEPYPMPPELQGLDLLRQTRADADLKSAGCVTCHLNTHDPHANKNQTLNLGCCDCHGGNPNATAKEAAHVRPRFPSMWQTAANPVRSYTLLNHEYPEFIRFMNPGDLRVAHISCGTTNCHPTEVLQNRKSMMTHGCMLWNAALYNNGAIINKRARYGESYSMHGTAQRLQTVPLPGPEEMRRGVVPFLDPLPRFEISQPGNTLRIFERGGRFELEIGLPEKDEDPGKPRTKLSTRGFGTKNRTDPVFIGLQKTRLLDPTLNFIGTNDQPGDYRNSGCTACHFIYANDRSRVHSGPYAKYGHRGLAANNPDPTIPKDEPGHPIEHKFALGIPTSQCMVCHPHPGTTVMNSYLGFMWWDEETDANLIYPKKQKYPSAEEAVNVQMRNPNESAVKSNLADPEFLARVAELNEHAKHTQFADFHGHGWVFRAVYKQDRKGNLLDNYGNKIPNAWGNNDLLRQAMYNQDRAPGERKHPPGVPVHLMDIHLEKGMHCADCHFVQDNHGNTRLQMEVRAAVEIHCIDCHGTATQKATLRTSGPASYTSSPDGKGRSLAALRTPFGKRRFEWEGGKLYQNSMVEEGLRWPVVQTMDTVNPESDHYNPKSAIAKTVRFDKERGKMVWGDVPEDDKCFAHHNDNMNCIACHSSWNPSCFGCHLPQKANRKMPYLHWEGDVTRNYTSYNFQTLREDVFMLGRDGNATGNRINPSRSSCAIHVSSYNAQRESIYVQQQTISAEGMSGIAFSTNVPHTVRGKGATKMCTDCHVSRENDNNAVMAQLLMHGTQYTNWVGRYAWVASGEHGFNAVVVTERDEPQAVIGSYLHSIAFPDDYKKHVERGGRLEHAHEHPGKDIGQVLTHPFKKHEVLMVQNRGEYLYAACGEGGLRIYDIAFVDHKGFSERFNTAPVSPKGQQFYVPTKYATAVAAPTTIAPDPTRIHKPENHEAAVSLLYAFVYVVDKYEGLILVGAGTLLDGDPTNNFLKREVTFNPNGILNGARSISIVGNYAYIGADCGLVVVSLANPKEPKVVATVGEPFLKKPHAVQVQFRYAYVCDEEGVKVLNVTNLEDPRPVSELKMKEAHSIYLARTYAYVAAGSQGLVILDIEKPEEPRVDQVYNADGCINDLHDVKLGITYTSEFAYLADGKNGLRVVQLTTPETYGNSGFSPRPTPHLIATFKIPKGGHALNIAKGIDRDRAIDESGNQIAVFGRVGARPLSLEEQRKMYLRDGQVWTVSDHPEDPRYERWPYRRPQQK